MGSLTSSRFRKTLGVGGVLFLLFLVILAVLPERLTGLDPVSQNTRLVLASPGTEGHLLGCDFLGRDNLSRLISGSGVSLLIGVSVGVLSTVLGAFWGLFSGYSGGAFDTVLMRLLEVWYALPELLIATILMLVLGHGIVSVIIALSIGGWMGVARVVRAETLKIREQAYLEAARSLGAPPLRLLLRHFLPNLLPVLFVLLLFRIPGGILGESTLSFLGLGLSPPASSWGTLVNEGWKALPLTPWILAFPALMIVLALLAFQWAGEESGARWSR
ncbi:MAG: ABC transporter permease [Leptospirales bacterium]